MEDIRRLSIGDAQQTKGLSSGLHVSREQFSAKAMSTLKQTHLDKLKERCL